MITGPMFSGKTAELIRRVVRLRIGGKSVQLFKYNKDSRYGTPYSMASYNGSAIDATPTGTVKAILEALEIHNDVFVIDEVQFYDDAIVDCVRGLIDLQKDVLCAGLNLDFRGEPFAFAHSQKNVSELLVRADKIVKLSAICTHSPVGEPCGAPATRTQRIIDGVPSAYDSPVVLIGSRESYEARCVRHHFVPGTPLREKIILKEREIG